MAESDRDRNFQNFVTQALKEFGWTNKDYGTSAGRTDRTIAKLKSEGSPDSPPGREMLRIFKAMGVTWSDDFVTYRIPSVKERYQIHFDFSYDPQPEKKLDILREAMSIIGVHLIRLRNEQGVTAGNDNSITFMLGEISQPGFDKMLEEVFEELGGELNVRIRGKGRRLTTDDIPTMWS